MWQRGCGAGRPRGACRTPPPRRQAKHMRCGAARDPRHASRHRRVHAVTRGAHSMGSRISVWMRLCLSVQLSPRASHSPRTARCVVLALAHRPSLAERHCLPLCCRHQARARQPLDAATGDHPARQPRPTSAPTSPHPGPGSGTSRSSKTSTSR